MDGGGSIEGSGSGVSVGSGSTGVAAGDVLGVGERFGLIRFGSRVDVYLPAGSTVLVGLGQKAVAGETVLADLGGGPERLFKRI